MAGALSFILAFQYFLLTFFHYSSIAANANYNLQSLGAKSDGKTDCSKAFFSAWTSACASTQPATIYVPPGRYLLGAATFAGKSCKNTAITIQIDGTLVAPSDFNVIGNSGNWIKFESVTGVSVIGGTLNGQGANLWACKNSGKSCPTGATTLAFYNSNNIIMNGLFSINSQKFNILVDGCHNAKLVGIKVSAPGNSPNTDGIHVEKSTGVTIMNSQIGTGDDCVSIGPGTSNLWIETIACGPGHGISIGSLGWDLQEPGVQNVTVKSATFTGTQNGARVKTWARPSNGFVKNILFQHLVMVNVQNPIIIDQNYCPDDHNCPNQAFLSAWSSACASAEPAAICVPPGRSLLGAATFGGISLEDVALTFEIDGTLVASSCFNVIGNSCGWVEFDSVTGVSVIVVSLDGYLAYLWFCKNFGHSCLTGAMDIVAPVSRSFGLGLLDAAVAMELGTQNGARVKTWARPSNGFVKNILFQHLVMVNVQNPIIINQNYCPDDHNCPNQVSGVKISDVTYQDIHGSSATETAVKFDCSKGNPCSDITLEDVKLTYKNEPAHSSCINAIGKSSGSVEPNSCLSL
ncbi:polygalacturonase-like [Olea europaea subsp. europaea]|uniref:Polygalacturonase-like n=1 Tax=Olea europaea subsp. europaea TaxID=158383 RepID=A0A8S0SUW2_OLEEU|nr:polygalacturonase-like [Olea europaea subsp. europaea]